MPYLSEMNAVTGFLAPEAVQAKGSELSERYQRGIPFPHIIIDDFLPEGLIDRCIPEFGRHRVEDSIWFDRNQERLKREIKPDTMSPDIRILFYSFNSRPFIQVLENITGIKGLIPDPYYLGGGFHEMRTNGHLSVHSDFNHHRLMNLERRINVLIYLNRDWVEGYGGQLELWDSDMTRCEVSVVPCANRCVIFNTTSDSNHGNPQPVSHPSDISRKSIALYYYTATWSPEKRSHTTQFRTRPRSADRFDWTVRLFETITDLTPPVAMRALSRAKRAMKSQGSNEHSAPR
jgi:2OG-Fe(II) oxygenase superfamily